MAGHNQTIGKFGEEVAAEWFENEGYAILARNWRCKEGEIDLVTRTGHTIAFVEVKTRSSDRYGTGAEAVGYRKQQRIRTSALRWLATQSEHFEEIRFDVIEVNRAGHIQAHLGCF